MNASKLALGILAVLGLSLLAAPASSAFDWTGTWVGSVDTKAIGVDTITLLLKKAGPTYTGTINDSLGVIDKDAVIAEVKLEGNEISFSFKAMGGSADFVMKMTVDGDKFAGQLMNKAVGEWGPFESLAKK